MKCFICEKQLIPVIPEKPDNCQPYDGGEISFYFCYGSKLDQCLDFQKRDPNNENTYLNKLLCCHPINGVICDECFIAKAHLLIGFQRDEKNILKRVV